MDGNENSQKAFFLSKKFGITFKFLLDGDSLKERGKQFVAKFIKEKNKDSRCFFLLGNKDERLENFFEKKYFKYSTEKIDPEIVRDKILECKTREELGLLFSKERFLELEKIHKDLCQA